MKISVASGKGGTGKTTIAVNLALTLQDVQYINCDVEACVQNVKVPVPGVQYIDCDVEEPNGHIFLKPRIEESIPVGIPIPEVDISKCTQCGLCAKVCEYHAIIMLGDTVMVFPELCHGCGGCSYLCPAGAIQEVEREIGVIEKGKAETIEFVQGRLKIGEAMAPPLIKEEKKNINNNKIVILDSPPGTSCPVVTTVKGTDFCLLVTEPTPFGLNDLKLAVEMVRVMAIPLGVVINVADIGTKEVWNYCEKENISILGEIPFDRKIAEAYSTGIPLVKQFPEYKEKFLKIYQKIMQRMAL